jgi:hypothetical protein
MVIPRSGRPKRCHPERSGEAWVEPKDLRGGGRGKRGLPVTSGEPMSFFFFRPALDFASASCCDTFEERLILEVLRQAQDDNLFGGRAERVSPRRPPFVAQDVTHERYESLCRTWCRG